MSREIDVRDVPQSGDEGKNIYGNPNPNAAFGLVMLKRRRPELKQAGFRPGGPEVSKLGPCIKSIRGPKRPSPGICRSICMYSMYIFFILCVKELYIGVVFYVHPKP